MAEKMGLAQYFVFKRPRTETGKILYGKQLGGSMDAQSGVFTPGETLLLAREGYTSVIEAATNKVTGVKLGVGATTKGNPTATNVPLTQGEIEFKDMELVPIDGQPWILHSIHFSVDEAMKSARPLAIKLGEDNVKICKGLSHELNLDMV